MRNQSEREAAVSKLNRWVRKKGVEKFYTTVFCIHDKSFSNSSKVMRARHVISGVRDATTRDDQWIEDALAIIKHVDSFVKPVKTKALQEDGSDQ